MELVILLDEEGNPMGTAPKSDVHGVDTPLHLAFSCYLFDAEGRVLVTRRSLTKRTWPGVWTNSFCGHPAPGEDPDAAVVRRAAQELGVAVRELRLKLPDFRYRAVDASGVVENEVCPVYTARIDGELAPDPDEVSEWAWVDFDVLRTTVASAPFAFSPWMHDQLDLLTDTDGSR